MKPRYLAHLAVAALVLACAAASVRAGEPRSEGTASWFGPGDGVATQWCTWTLRHTAGCGLLAVESLDTGVVVVVPVVDWCECYRGTADERIVDLQWGVLDALGLDRSAGLYPVATWRVDGGAPIDPLLSVGGGVHAAGGGVSPVMPPAALPDTAVLVP